MSSDQPHEVVVVGGGPAGLAAAASAAAAGCEVLLLDGAVQLGGQYYRALPAAMAARDPGRLHHAFGPGAALIEQVRRSPRVQVRSGTSVFAAVPAGEPGGAVELHVQSAEGGTAVVGARTVVLATGAHDRSLPFPGWDLPGVLTAGGAQALLKGQYTLPGRRVVVGGTGPFLLPVAAGLAEAGAHVLGVYEAASPRAWLRHPAALVAGAGKLGEAAHYARVLVRHGVRVHFRSTVTAAHGTDQVEGVTVSEVDAAWQVRPGTDRRLECDAVCVGWGFTPNVELAVALGLRTREEQDGSLAVVADEYGRTSVSAVLAAGEVAGVAGSVVARTEGRLAGLAAAARAGRLDEVALRVRAKPLLATRRRQRLFGRGLLDVYPVRPGWTSWCQDDTVLCRCEEVTVGQVRRATADLGATDLRSLKLLTRVGMGPCQGRVCGTAAAQVVAQCAGRPVDPTPFAKRPFAVPVTLGDLARHPAD
jgi:NADPH-dependent 2,4-dienoyl-CoA reductase/sulfur reductase-like enzyme